MTVRIATLLALLPACALATPDEVPFARLNAAEATAKVPDADSSRVVFENEKVRIVLYHTTSGKNLCGFGMHSHPAHAYIQLQPAKFRVTTPDGSHRIDDTRGDLTHAGF